MGIDSLRVVVVSWNDEVSMCFVTMSRAEEV